MACAPSKDSDQPGHPPSLTRVFACAHWVAKDPRFLHADSEDSDQTGRVPRLIRVFAVRTCHFVVFFFTRRLIIIILMTKFLFPLQIQTDVISDVISESTFPDTTWKLHGR